jgi:ankyrin repeat protein
MQRTMYVSTSCQSTSFAAKAQRNLRFVIGRGSSLTPIDIQDGETALALASGNGHVEVVKVLLAAEADVHVEDDVSLHN